MEFGQQILVAAGFLGVLALVAVQLRRQKGLGFSLRSTASRTRQLESVERLALTPTHSLHLVRVAGRQLLIGISPSGCNLLEQDPNSRDGSPSRPAKDVS